MLLPLCSPTGSQQKVQVCANGEAEGKLHPQLHTLQSYYFEANGVQEPKFSRKKIRKAGSRVPLMKKHTIPHVGLVELATTGDHGDRHHWQIQEGLHKFMDSWSINRKGTGGNAPCNISNPTVVDLVQRNGNVPEEMTKLARSH